MVVARKVSAVDADKKRMNKEAELIFKKYRDKVGRDINNKALELKNDGVEFPYVAQYLLEEFIGHFQDMV